MEHVGATLRRMREEQGLTLEDVARMTRIRAEILHGLEQGDHHQISEGPFLRGFVKSYAQSLGKSEQEIEDLLNSVKSSRTEAAKHPSQGHQRHQPTFRVWYGVGGLAVFAAIIAVLLLGRGHDRTADPVSTQIPETKPPVQAAMPQPEPATVTKAEPSSSSAPAAHPAVHMEIRAQEPCWVSVLLDNAPYRSALLAAGETRSWDGQKGGFLTLGNAGGVVVLVNGREYANLGGKGEVLRDIAVTPKGLRLPKEHS